jgi:protein-tyrosine phosphatase
VPFISQVTDTLWVGGCQSGLILPPHIKHIVSLYQWEQYRLHAYVESALTVKMYDSLDGPDHEQVVAIARWVNLCQRTGPTLVHCQAGLNRSNLVAATSLMLLGTSAEAAIALLRAARSPAVLCNPTFSAWLGDLDVSHSGRRPSDG